MAFLVGDNAAFIHVPRTAGRWVREALKQAGVDVRIAGPNGRGHSPLDEAWGVVGNRIIFSACRHPMLWLISFWTSTWKNNWVGWHNPVNALLRHRRTEFDAFLEEYLKHSSGMITRIWDQFVGDPDDDRVRYFIRHEQLASGLNLLMSTLGIDCDDEKIHELQVDEDHQSPERDIILESIHEELFDRLYESEKQLYDRFGYESKIGDHFFRPQCFPI